MLSDSELQRIASDQKILLFAACLSSILAGAEIVGGYISGSLSLLGDALHLSSDIAGYVVGIVGLTLCRRPASLKMSFGYDRAESLAALLSLILIWLMSGSLLWGAFGRFQNPHSIDSLPMLIVAAIGLLGNIL